MLRLFNFFLFGLKMQCESIDFHHYLSGYGKMFWKQTITGIHQAKTKPKKTQRFNKTFIKGEPWLKSLYELTCWWWLFPGTTLQDTTIIMILVSTTQNTIETWILLGFHWESSHWESWMFWPKARKQVHQMQDSWKARWVKPTCDVLHHI